MKRKLLFTVLASVIFLLSHTPGAFAIVHTIQVGAGSGFSFVPSSGVVAAVGDTIDFVWVGGTHTTTSTTIPAGATPWDSPMDGSTTDFMYVPTVAGTYNYQCNFHYPMGMVGSFVVTTPVTHTIQVGAGAGFSFVPASGVSAAIGDTIQFVWVTGEHTTTSTTIPDGATSWDSPSDGSTPVFAYVPTIAGTYNYQCNFHYPMGMIGSFVVTAPVTHIIQVGAGAGFSFVPASGVSAAIGDTIRFVWVTGNHTTTSTTIPAGAATWDNPSNSAATTFDYIPTVAGTYNYQCSFHYPMGMIGSFVVTGTGGPPTSVWIGGTSTDWNTAANWSPAAVPTSTDSVSIPSGTVNVASSFTMVALNVATTVTIGSHGTLNVTGSVTNNGAITCSGAGSVVLDGTAAQSISGTGTITNLTLNNAAGATIASGSNVKITGIYTNTAGTLTTNSGLTLVSTASGTARVAAITGGNVHGSVNVQQYVPGATRAFRFFSHPFSSSIALSQLTGAIDITGIGGSANGFTGTTTNNPSAFWYNPATGNGSSVNDNTGWVAFTNTNGVGTNAWNAKEGIRLLVRGTQGQGLNGISYTPNAVTLTMAGSLNQGSISIPFTVGANSAYNLLGNPYPSPVDIGTPIFTARQGGNISGSGFWVWNAETQPEGAYVTVPITNIPYDLPANAAFIIKAATNSSLSFTEANKATSGSALFKTTNNNTFVTLHLYDTSGNSWDQLYLQFNQDASDSMEDNDGAKLHNSALDLYTLSADNKELSIDARPYKNGQIISLGIQTNALQSYVLKTESFNVPAGAQLLLHDKYLNQMQYLQMGSQYTFTVTADTASQNNNRFEIETVTDASTGVGAVKGDNGLTVYIAPNPATDKTDIRYSGALKGEVSINMIDVTGKIVYTTNATGQSGTVVVPLQSLAPGYYVIVTQSGNQKVINKLIKE